MSWECSQFEPSSDQGKIEGFAGRICPPDQVLRSRESSSRAPTVRGGAAHQGGKLLCGNSLPLVLAVTAEIYIAGCFGTAGPGRAAKTPRENARAYLLPAMRPDPMPFIDSDIHGWIRDQIEKIEQAE